MKTPRAFKTALLRICLIGLPVAAFWLGGLTGRTVRWGDRILHVGPGGRIVRGAAPAAARLPEAPGA